MTNWTDDEERLLRVLIAKAQNDPDFSSDDVELLREIIQAFAGFRAFGRFTKWIVVGLAGLAGALAAWEAVLLRMKQWLGS